MIKKIEKSMFHFCCYLQHFGNFFSRFFKKIENRDSTKVAQSVVNSSKNGTLILNSSSYFVSFFFKIIVFYNKKEGAKTRPRPPRSPENRSKNAPRQPLKFDQKLGKAVAHFCCYLQHFGYFLPNKLQNDSKSEVHETL